MTERMTGANLIPAARREAKQRRARQRVWIVICCLYGALLVTGYGVCHGLLGTDDRALDNQARKAAARVSAFQRRLADLQGKLDEAQRKLQANLAVGDQPDWSVLLTLLADTLDDDLVLSQCRIQPPGHAKASRGPEPQRLTKAMVTKRQDRFVLTVSGFGRTQAAVSRFVLRLEKTDLFNQVKLVKANREPFLADKAVAFLVECSLGRKTGAST